MAVDEEQILRAAIAGDRAALTTFVRETQTHVWRYCAYVGSGLDAADLVQETYLRALRALPRFEGRSSARTWLLAIAQRVCADAIRAARRRRTLDALWRRDRVVSDPADGVATAMVLDDLAPDRRDAFVLTQIVGLAYVEAAEVCGVPIGTIRSRVARAREDLQHGLGEATG